MSITIHTQTGDVKSKCRILGNGMADILIYRTLAKATFSTYDELYADYLIRVVPGTVIITDGSHLAIRDADDVKNLHKRFNFLRRLMKDHISVEHGETMYVYSCRECAVGIFLMKKYRGPVDCSKIESHANAAVMDMLKFEFPHRGAVTDAELGL